MIKEIFAEPMYHAMEIISEEENQKIIDECYRLQAITESGHLGWDCDIYTTFGSGDPLNFNRVFDKLHEVTKEHIDKFKEEAKGSYDLECNNAWFNIAGAGQFQEQHLHPGSWFSAIYYVRVPEGSSGTKFKTPYDNQMGEIFGSNSPYNRHHRVDPIERSLLIFPSHLPHWVPWGKNTEDRITIASNWG